MTRRSAGCSQRKERRAFSHGCVRVDNPFRFAENVLGKGWTEARAAQASSAARSAM